MEQRKKLITPELTVCDIIGHFGLYQWSLTIFATIYSSLPSLTVIIGPIWTPDLAHLCASDYYHAQSLANGTSAITSGNNNSNLSKQVDFSSMPHQCFSELDGKACSSFIYDDANYGTILTNNFDLVCDRQWLRSFISSSALTGMLISSVTLGLLSDKYGRKRMILVGFVISILATITALLAQNYLILNVSYMLMSFSQVGVANALCVLVMEATPPKLRFVGVFEYGIGWGLGQAMVPFMNDLTKNYKHFILILLVLQLCLLPYLHWGVFESIRWLISEGNINKAQIELRRACKWNRKTNGAQLAQKIAQVQVQQLRKASSVIETKLAPTTQPAEQLEANRELSALNHTIRLSIAQITPPPQPISSSKDYLETEFVDSSSQVSRDFRIDSCASENPAINSGGAGEVSANQADGELLKLQHLSPTLARKSFCSTRNSSVDLEDDNVGQLMQQRHKSMIMGQLQKTQERQSLTTQALVQLALKHSNAIQKEEEGNSFLVRMFHRKLYRMTVLLMLISVMLETSYYSLIQANRFVGTDVNLNYYTGAIIEWIGAFVFILVLWAFNRRIALVLPTMCASLACLGIALAYHFIPDSSSSSSEKSEPHHQHQHHQHQQLNSTQTKYLDVDRANITGSMDPLPGSLIVNDTLQFLYPIASEELMKMSSITVPLNGELLELRERINFWLMILGKLSITVAIQIGTVIAMEAYPNNLRQSGSGAIVFVGRIGSIVAPFLINDNSPERTIFKLTLIGLASLGVLISMLVPCFLPDNKDLDLCDRLNEIPDNDDRDQNQLKENQ